MDIKLIFDGKATLEDMMFLYETKGIEFVLENGKVSSVIQHGSRKTV